MTTECELANDSRAGSSRVEVSRDVAAVAKSEEENEAVLQDASYNSVIPGKQMHCR